MVTFNRLLDIGVQTLLVPYIQTAEEARNAVLFTRYRPQGVRGYVGAPRASNYDRVKGYAQPSAEKLACCCRSRPLKARKTLKKAPRSKPSSQTSTPRTRRPSIRAAPS